MDQETLHVGRDGIDIKGRENIMIFTLLVLAFLIIVAFYLHLDKDIEDRKVSHAKMDSLQQDHRKLVDAVESLAESTKVQNNILTEQNCILLADEKETERIRKASRWTNGTCVRIMTDGR